MIPTVAFRHAMLRSTASTAAKSLSFCLPTGAALNVSTCKASCHCSTCLKKNQFAFQQRSHSAAASGDADIDVLLKNNKAWVDGVNAEDSTFFPKLGAGQAPKYLYIGCADSRVAVGKLMGIEMGDVFIHRNIANMVVASDISFLSVLSYSVEYLKVKHILVTGHYDCGGVRAAATKDAKGQILDAWLQNVRDVYRLHKVELDGITDETARHHRMVELNVQEQCLNVYKTSIVQRRRLQTFKDSGSMDEVNKVPQVHGMVFDPATGILKKLPIDFPKILESGINDTYDLF
jgi:carbonic anhydrase